MNVHFKSELTIKAERGTDGLGGEGMLFRNRYAADGLRLNVIPSRITLSGVNLKFNCILDRHVPLSSPSPSPVDQLPFTSFPRLVRKNPPWIGSNVVALPLSHSLYLSVVASLSLSPSCSFPARSVFPSSVFSLSLSLSPS